VARIADRLRQLGITLPTAPKPVANCTPAKHAGPLLYIAGQVSSFGGRDYKGVLFSDADVSRGREAAKASAINCLAAMLSAIDSLDRVRRLVHVGGFVASAPGFQGQAAVVNGASDLFLDVFGDAGRHTRIAVGVGGLPLDYTTSVYVIAELSDHRAAARTAYAGVSRYTGRWGE
jgi:enamine deaminase RidA (YjgF/YER057c/UK114 family)